MDVAPQIFTSVAMGALVFSVGFIEMPELSRLIIKIFTGVISYLAISRIFKIPALNMFTDLIKGKRKDN